MRCLLEGRSALAVFPTGGGKSLCYQLPAMMLDGLTIVVSPLIALMKDQVDALQRRGLPAARLDSSLSLDDWEAIEADWDAGKLKLLYVAPERFADERFRKRLQSSTLSLLAIDEAHCISEWGHHFRPDYLKLARMAAALSIPRVLALTATATPEVSQDICQAFGIQKADHIQLSFHRSNLELRVTPCLPRDRDARLLERLRGRPMESVIIYVTRQFTAEAVATMLQREGIRARAYHAGLPDGVRASCQEAFLSGDVPVMVATIAFGMGIDKADIRAIYHYNLPKSLENYSQEIGRAGRDGGLAVCEMFACAGDLITLENFAYADTPAPVALRQLIDHVLRQGESIEVSFYDLSVTHDIRLLVVETIMAALELEGILEPTRPFYQQYGYRYVRDLSHVLRGREAEERALLRRLLTLGEKAWGWQVVDVSAAATELEVTAEEVATTFHELEAAGDLYLKPKRKCQGYRLLTSEVSPRAVADRLHAQMAAREAHDLDRLRRVVALSEEPHCLTNALLEYFGEHAEQACGHCSRCQGKAAQPVPSTTVEPCTQEELEMIMALTSEKHPALRSPRQLTRFLCGLVSPAAARARLTRRDEFGLLERLPFEEVLAQMESLILR